VLSVTLEMLVAGGLAIFLVGIALFFGRSQLRTLDLLKQDQQLSALDRTYLRKQVRRRLLSCVLLVVFAAFLVGLMFLDKEFRALSDRAKEVPPGGDLRDDPVFTLLTLYVIGGCLVLFILLAIAATDLVATARFGLSQQRILNAQRNAALAAEIAKLRQTHQNNGQRNGDG